MCFALVQTLHMPWGLLFILGVVKQTDILILWQSPGLQAPVSSRISEQQPQDTATSLADSQIQDHVISIPESPPLYLLSASLFYSLPTGYISILLPIGLSFSDIKILKMTGNEHEHQDGIY